MILTAEEIVDEAVIRSDPNRTLIPGLVVDAVCHVPHACHPSYAQGYYDRDNEFYLEWDRISQSPQDTTQWLDEWVMGSRDRAQYWEKLGAEAHRAPASQAAAQRGHQLWRVLIGAPTPEASALTHGRQHRRSGTSSRRWMLGGDGPELVFLHANGYPPNAIALCSRHFAADFRVRAMSSAAPLEAVLHRQLDRFLARAQLRTSSPGCDAAACANRSLPLGIRMGAIVALRAALREPARFAGSGAPRSGPGDARADPGMATDAAPAGMGHRLHAAIRRAERRRRVFRDVDEVFAAYRRHPSSATLADDQLQVVIQGLVQPVDGHVQLRYSPEWEARIYSTAIWNDGDLWRGLPTLSVPTLIVRGAESETLTEAACEAARRDNGRDPDRDRRTNHAPCAS